MDEAEGVSGVTLPAYDQAAEVMEPREPPLDLPAPPVAAQRPAVLGRPAAVGTMGRDQFDALFQQRFIHPIAVVGPVADESRRRRLDGAQLLPLVHAGLKFVDGVGEDRLKNFTHSTDNQPREAAWP